MRTGFKIDVLALGVLAASGFTIFVSNIIAWILPWRKIISTG